MLAGMEKGWSQSMDRLAASVAGKAAPGGTSAEDEAQIRTVLADRAQALHEKDLALAVRHLAEDAVMFTLAPPLEHRGAKARDRVRLEAWFATWRGPIGWELRDPDIAVGGDVAFVRALGDDPHQGPRPASRPLDAQHRLPPPHRRHLEDRARAHLGALLHGRQLQGRGRP